MLHEGLKRKIKSRFLNSSGRLHDPQRRTALALQHLTSHDITSVIQAARKGALQAHNTEGVRDLLDHFGDDKLVELLALTYVGEGRPATDLGGALQYARGFMHPAARPYLADKLVAAALEDCYLTKAVRLLGVELA